MTQTQTLPSLHPLPENIDQYVRQLLQTQPRRPGLEEWLYELVRVSGHLSTPLAIDSVVSVDIDPRCAAVARSMNASHGQRFSAVTADMLDYPYQDPRPGAAPDLVVNTACEHLPDFASWYGRSPRGQLLALQSNDYFAVAEHVNCVPDLEAFRRQAPLAETLFAGSRRHKKYTRFMLLGRK